MRAFRPLLIVIGLSTCLSGCGQKGALTLPDAQRAHRKIGVVRPPAPAASNAPTSPPPPR
jgi:Prokaryotic lipoprotein-attachment site